MATIIMSDWKYGLEKVSLTKLQVDLLGKSLSESKNNVDKLLDGEEIKIEEIDIQIAKLFIEKACEIGVISTYIP